MDIEEFIERWQGSGGSEMATAQSFAIELTELLGVERPYVSDKDGDFLDYRFERPVTLTHTGRTRNGRIDLYKKGHFILEAKQFTSTGPKDKNTLEMFLGKDAPKQSGHGKRGTAKFDDTMLKARAQADNYARAVSKEDGWPPFLMIVDVGHVIELYSDFSGQGQGYTQFPDGNRYRIYLEDLGRPETLDLLRAIWSDPQSLDPSLKSAEVTREIAEHLAELGKSFEGQGHDSETVARFLMRCLFSMFAEDVDLIPYGSFTAKLKELRGHPEHAQPTLKSLWQTMNTGGFSPVLTKDLKRFNGGLFKDADALPLDNLQLGLLIEAAEADWKQVEPAIFGTLLERALDAKQRHKLGAHYTPRAYVERLVTPTIMEPLRDNWRNVQIAVQRLNADGKTDQALKLVKDFHHDLCEVRVLDPACGSGNFLYVALEMMKRLEGEVTSLMEELGETQTSFITVDPHQFLGIELNTWAANVAELVLWIGYLQWHYRTHGIAAPSEPVLRDFKNIENRDAVLEWSARTPRVDENGTPVTRWDGVTTMRHQVTGEEVPDPEARVQVYDYAKPKATTWPKATFIVGNPPFIGASRLRDALGDGYVEALWSAYPKMPQSADLVMFWWEKAALMARAFNIKTRVGTRRFGLITTNSLRQTFNRRVLEPHLNDPKKPLSLLFAVPDHPWVDTLYGAAVRIAMTVGAAGNRAGHLLTVTSESKDRDDVDGRVVSFDRQDGKIFANLQIGADVASVIPLLANTRLSARGAFLVGKGFLGTERELKELCVETNALEKKIVRPFLGGYDLSQRHRKRWVIDFWGLSENDARLHYPLLYQHLLDTVKPVREENPMLWRRENWWVFGDPSRSYRAATDGLKFSIVTSRTAKFRCFQMWSTDDLCESEVVVIGLDEAWPLGILSSRLHEVWSLAIGGWMGVGNDPRYNNSKCFDPFPFPDLTDPQKIQLSALGEELDTHRKRQQAAHPKLTLTNMYNVLEKLRTGEAIEGKDKEIYDQGLIGILRDLHDQIDTAVADAYGWPVDLSDEEILMRLVDLNKERAAEEAAGHIRWLRPDYQNPTGAKVEKGKTTDMDLGVVAKVEKAPWPKGLPDQIAAVREALVEMGEASPEQIARRFARARTTAVQPLLESLAALGQADKTEDGKYAA
ncbi:class I SAM-dependent DNA methyltransferase [Phaeobacter inhibens]|uniref:class I SAM-dependent DNA methyltransferase n=1 Tax=Phaeobacter inhibens TaxID=221822 RepID=UPI0021A8C12E|nr:DNA methyltransferase [Phaeobacter inhibens]UWR58195.1 class I SAM-dependent DNA methyltransferase [Phaeobacter inhibens]UWR79986.1 class I SAM-dependent DNA methyltransferase [Phaeobacter inhibens]